VRVRNLENISAESAFPKSAPIRAIASAIAVAAVRGHVCKSDAKQKRFDLPEHRFVNAAVSVHNPAEKPKKFSSWQDVGVSERR
jgi:hypothetical protein